MRTKHLIQSLVGTKKIVVKDISIESETNTIIIAACPTKGEQCRCGLCQQKSKFYDHGRGIRRWRCGDIGSSKVYIEAEAPRVVCKKHGVVTAAVP